MSIKNRSEMFERPIEIDLSGPDGNAFALLGYAKRFSEALSLDPNEICNEMISSDYEHLVETFDAAFGDFVTLYR